MAQIKTHQQQERERERERERQRDRQTERQREIQRERERERENMHKNKSDRKVCNRTTVSNTIRSDELVSSTKFEFLRLNSCFNLTL